MTAGEPTAVRVRFKNDLKQEQIVQGRIVTRAKDGGILLEAVDSRLWTITPENLLAEESLNQPFALWNPEELQRALTTEFGSAFTITRRERYLLCSDAEQSVVEGIGRLLTRLDNGFQKFWQSKLFPLQTSEQLFVAVIFKRHADYVQYATGAFGPDVAKAPGFFSMIHNRMVLYDVTEDEGSSGTRSIDTRLESRLRQVTNVVHEATHQLAFNLGMETRLADNPLWLTEGLAMYFEAPDFHSRTGWTTAGKLHRGRLQTFLTATADKTRPLRLKPFLSSDAAFQQASSEGAAYATSWALTWYLLQKKPEQFVKYLQTIRQKRPLIWDTPEQRLREFEQAFGSAEELERDLQRAFDRYRRPGSRKN